VAGDLAAEIDRSRRAAALPAGPLIPARAALQVRHSLAIGNDLQHLAAGERELAPTFLR
jgi:hypothetical protein